MIAERLLNPVRRVPLDRLTEVWAGARIEVTLPGFGALRDNLVLMNRIRGAIGRVLMEGASSEALAERPCSWQPPCALDLFFREQARIEGKHGIPKPWVLALDRRGLDLVVRVTLFGFAMDWAAIFVHALVTALQHKIDWKACAPNLFLPRGSTVRQVEVKDLVTSHLPCPRPSVLLRFITPLDTAGDDPLDRPGTIIGRLARRIDLLSRWMDAEIDTDWRALSEIWNAADFDTGELKRQRLARRSGRAQHNFQLGLLQGVLGIAGDLAPIWPLLVLGQSSHVGRGGASGLGRYVLQ